MKLNLTVIADELTEISILDRSLNKDLPMLLRLPVYYHPGEPFRSDRLYICRGCELPPDPECAETDPVSLIAIGIPLSSIPAKGWDVLIVGSDTVKEILFEKILDIFEKYEKLEKELDTVLQRRDPFGRIGDIAFGLFQNPVCATDPYDNFLFIKYNPLRPEMTERYRYHWGSEYIAPEEREIIYMDEDFSRTIREEPNAFYSEDALKIYGVRGIIFNLYRQHVFEASVWIEEVYHPVRESDYPLLKWIGGYAGRILEYYRNKGEDNAADFEKIIKSLLTDSAEWEDYYHRILTAKNWRKEDPYIFICTIGKQLSEESSPLQRAVKQIRSLYSSRFAAMVNGALVQLINLRVEKISEAQIRQRLLTFFRGRNTFSGLSCVFYDLADARSHYQQSLDAADYSLFKNGPSLCSFEKNASEVILWLISKERPSRFFITNSMQKLIRYDNQYHTELVRTLRCYLDCNLNATRTQDLMNIARTTCIYRINRIREITGFDFEDSQTVLYLKMAFVLF